MFQDPRLPPWRTALDNVALGLRGPAAPLLLELGASVPARGLFVVSVDVERADELARAWAA